MPTTFVTRRYHFEAAHWLPFVSDDHKCHRIHGHNYEVEITINGGNRLRPDGFVIDFWDLDKIVQPIIDAIDHRCLNDIPGLENPTAELIARYFYETIGKSISVFGVRVYETKDCWSDYVEL